MTILNVIDAGGKKKKDMRRPLCSRQRRCAALWALLWEQTTEVGLRGNTATNWKLTSLCSSSTPPPLFTTEHNALIIHTLFQVWIIQKSGSRRAQTVGDHSTHSRMFSLPENPAAHPPSVAAAPSLCCCPPRSTALWETFLSTWLTYWRPPRLTQQLIHERQKKNLKKKKWNLDFKKRKEKKKSCLSCLESCCDGPFSVCCSVKLHWEQVRPWTAQSN